MSATMTPTEALFEDVELVRSLPNFDFVTAREIALRAWMFRNPNSSFEESDGFLNRITVNYLRHRWTSYDDLLRTPEFSSPAAQLALKHKVLDHLTMLFPRLREECEAQRRQANRFYETAKALSTERAPRTHFDDEVTRLRAEVEVERSRARRANEKVREYEQKMLHLAHILHEAGVSA